MGARREPFPLFPVGDQDARRAVRHARARAPDRRARPARESRVDRSGHRGDARERHLPRGARLRGRRADGRQELFPERRFGNPKNGDGKRRVARDDARGRRRAGGREGRASRRVRGLAREARHARASRDANGAVRGGRHGRRQRSVCERRDVPAPRGPACLAGVDARPPAPPLGGGRELRGGSEREPRPQPLGKPPGPRRLRGRGDAPRDSPAGGAPPARDRVGGPGSEPGLGA